MPPVPSTPRVKLRATSRRVPRTRAVAGEAEVEVDAEPNMRLSRAVLVMLLLHVVAVGGILAFSLIKERNSDRPMRDPAGNSGAAVEAEESHLPTTKPIPRPEPALANGKNSVHVVQPGETLLRIANDNGVTVEALIAANGARTAMSSLRPGQSLKLPEKSPEPASNSPDRVPAAPERRETGSNNPPPAPTATKAAARPGADTGKTYTVGKGESPYAIAKKLKVSYESLSKLNHIDDPKKLKPGQKLRIPAMSTGKPKEG